MYFQEILFSSQSWLELFTQIGWWGISATFWFYIGKGVYLDSFPRASEMLTCLIATAWKEWTFKFPRRNWSKPLFGPMHWFRPPFRAFSWIIPSYSYPMTPGGDFWIFLLFDIVFYTEFIVMGCYTDFKWIIEDNHYPKPIRELVSFHSWDNHYPQLSTIIHNYPAAIFDQIDTS